jgi:hypothetical protein
MITIGIELNNVFRNINKQIIKYYGRDYANDYDTDNIDDNDDVFETYAKFDSIRERKGFLYIDYPYEIYGCAKTMTKDLQVEFNGWLNELTNIEDDEIRVVLFSLEEEALTIQSTLFFLSRMGTRVREIIFPKDISELDGKFDVVVTANNDILENIDINVGTKVKINRKWNKDVMSDCSYDSLSDFISDKEMLNKIILSFKKN